LFIHRRENLAGILQGLDESRSAHLIHQVPHLHITHAPDEFRDAKAFKPLWRVPKSGFGHRTEQVPPRRFKGNAWPVRRTDIGALLQL
jgi:hypothetical protein